MYINGNDNYCSVNNTKSKSTNITQTYMWSKIIIRLHNFIDLFVEAEQSKEMSAVKCKQHKPCTQYYTKQFNSQINRHF